MQKSRNLFTRNRPTTNSEIDQVHMDDQSADKTAKYLKKFIAGKNVAVIGDDDLLSFSFAELQARQIRVFDIDSRIIKHIDAISKNMKFPVVTTKYNVLSLLPEEHSEQFDFFYTNPPYGSKNQGDSCKAFILRGIQTCKVGGYGSYVIAAQSNLQWTTTAQENCLKFITENGCELIDKQESYQGYLNNPILSSIYLIRKIKKVVINEEFLSGIDLY